MRKATLLFVGIFTVVAMLTASLYSGVEKRKAVVKPAAEYVTLHATVADLAYYAEILNPGFVSNFNRLVVFPQEGSDAVASSPLAVTRGPPQKYRRLNLNV